MPGCSAFLWNVSFLLIAGPSLLINSLNIAGSTLTKFLKAAIPPHQAHSQSASTISFSYMSSSFGSCQWLIDCVSHTCLVKIDCWQFEVFPLHPLWDMGWLRRSGLWKWIPKIKFYIPPALMWQSLLNEVWMQS